MDVKAAAPVGGTMLGQAGDAAEAKIRADRMFRTRVAIQERRPIAGMTEDELVQAVGRPSVINASSGLNDAVRKQWVYRGKRDRYVYTENGTVTHIQWTE